VQLTLTLTLLMQHWISKPFQRMGGWVVAPRCTGCVQHMGWLQQPSAVLNAHQLSAIVLQPLCRGSLSHAFGRLYGLQEFCYGHPDAFHAQLSLRYDATLLGRCTQLVWRPDNIGAAMQYDCCFELQQGIPLSTDPFYLHCSTFGPATISSFRMAVVYSLPTAAGPPR